MPRLGLLIGFGIAPGCLLVMTLGAGCGGSSPTPTPPPMMLSRNLAPSADTFINKRVPDNNNGASASIYAGVDGMGGVLRGLIQFAMPAELQGRVTVTNVRLTATLRALGNGTAGPGTVDSLQAIAEPWAQGNGVGETPTLFVVGQACGGAVSGATWNQPNCAPGTTATWAAPGGTVAATVSGQADTTGVALEGHVTWDSAVAGNAGMNADVQGWIDDPTRNHGWRITSAGETAAVTAQRFYASEAGAATAPTLTISYTQ